jgi:hypothetical protein
MITAMTMLDQSWKAVIRHDITAALRAGHRPLVPSRNPVNFALIPALSFYILEDPVDAFVTLLVYLDATAPEAGATRVVARSHRGHASTRAPLSKYHYASLRSEFYRSTQGIPVDKWQPRMTAWPPPSSRHPGLNGGLHSSQTAADAQGRPGQISAAAVAAAGATHVHSERTVIILLSLSIIMKDNRARDNDTVLALPTCRWRQPGAG